MIKVLSYLLWPLLATLFIELSIGTLMRKGKKFLGTILIMNLITNPLMNLIRILLYAWGGWNLGVLPFLELAAWGYESGYIRLRHQWSGKRAMKSSLLLNAGSFFFGVLIEKALFFGG